jgi:hypothetical protein
MSLSYWAYIAIVTCLLFAILFSILTSDDLEEKNHYYFALIGLVGFMVLMPVIFWV